MECHYELDAQMHTQWQRTFAVQADTQYVRSMLRFISASSISTQNPGFEAPAQRNTASAGLHPCSAQAASYAERAPSSVSNAKEYDFNI
jgi:hypothetical protein